MMQPAGFPFLSVVFSNLVHVVRRHGASQPSICLPVTVLLAAVEAANAFSVVSARRSWVDHTKVSVAFSEAVDPVSATVASHYAIDYATISSAQVGATSSNIVLATSAIDLGPPPTLRINRVKNAALTQTLLNATAPVGLAALVPVEMGTTVNGFQDDFDAASRNPNWLALGPDVYTQSYGLLNVSAGGRRPQPFDLL